MTNQNIILVVGATGSQGGSVARHLLAGKKYAVRCLTRNSGSEKAKALNDAGADVVNGDLEDIESLKAAMEGCYGVFGVTNFWEHFSKEYQQGKNLVEAVVASNVEHFIFSTLPNANKISNGALSVPHFDIKAQLEKYTRGVGIHATFVHAAFYFENFLTYFMPQKQEDGTFAFGFPQGDTPLAGVAIKDLGGVVAAIFERPAGFRDKIVGVVGDDMPPQMYAEIMSRVLGKTVVYNHIPRDVYASFGFPGAEELANMFEFNRLHISDRKADLAESRSLYPGIQTFESWLLENKRSF